MRYGINLARKPESCWFKTTDFVLVTQIQEKTIIQSYVSASLCQPVGDHWTLGNGRPVIPFNLQLIFNKITKQ